MLTNMAALTLVDKAATPVAHIYSPVRSANGVPTWVDKEHNDGVAVGYSRVTYSCREPVKSGSVYRHNLTLSVPYVDFTIPEKPVLGATARVKLELLFPDIMSDQQRKDVVELTRSLLIQGASAQLGDNIALQSEPY